MVNFVGVEDENSWLFVREGENLSDLAIIGTKSRGMVDNDAGFPRTKSLL